MKFRKIACATDFSQGARIALLMAARIARMTDAELVIHHAWTIPVTGVMEGYVMPPSVIDAFVADGNRGLEEASQLVRDAGVTKVSTKLLTGVAWEAITDELERDETFDLVVVGTQGRTGLPRILLGSVAEKIIRHAPCSVLVVRPGNPIAPFEQVACPIDFAEESRYAVELAEGLVSPTGRGITLLHVLELPVSFGGPFEMPGFLEDLDKHATARLEEWTNSVRAQTKVPVTSQLRGGSPAAQVLAMLDSDPSYDLVVVGSHGRKGVRRLLLGSVAERVARHAKAPVLIARKRAKG